ncbi:MAG: helix-turn-helix transcriptional regulator [Alphaproteobacteria bacterium]|nr:helix-turn-helix transcriptional regulator [Alphaproteobacteria bacterium]
MKKKAGQAADFLKGLASAHRLNILCTLVDGERNVTDLIRKTGISQTSMSQHLAKLKKEGIVDFRRDHRQLFYYIKNPDVLRFIGILHDMYCK